MSHFYLRGFLSLILLKVVSGFEDTETISAAQEENVTLPCFSLNDMDPNSCYRYRVKKLDRHFKQVKDTFEWPTLSKDVHERVKWVADRNRPIRLTLTKLQKDDTGLYTCETWKGWDRVLVKNVSLKIKDCKAIEPVKAAPSMPAKLNCLVKVTTGQQKPQNISWSIKKGEKNELIDSSKAKSDGTFLTFQSVNTGDSGWYTCSYMLDQTQRCFDINLQVQDEAFVATTVPVIVTKTISQPAPTANRSLTQRKEESSDAIIAVVVCVILGMIIIAAVIGFVVYRRRKTQGITRLHQRRFDGNRMSTYEIVTPLANTSSQRINSLYQMPDGSLVTFQ